MSEHGTGTIIKVKGNPNGGEHFRDRTACGRGHEYVEGSWTYITDTMGRRSRRCVECRKLNKARQRSPEQRDKETLAQAMKRARARLSPEEYALWEIKNLAKKNPLDYLKLNEEQAAASDALNFALDKQKSKMACQKPVRIIHPTSGKEVDSFPFIDIDERVPYSAEQAKAMCEDCPVFKQCNPYAKALRPPVGVLGGISWVDRKPVK